MNDSTTVQLRLVQRSSGQFSAIKNAVETSHHIVAYVGATSRDEVVIR